MSANAPAPEWFKGVYKENKEKSGSKAPWDNLVAQPRVVEAESQGYFTGKILDVGSGLGDNAIFLGTKGHTVTAVDFSPEAVEEAKTRLAAAGPPAVDSVTFLQGDVLALADTLGAGVTFDTVLDSALLHCFPDEEQDKLVASISAHVRPGGKLLLLNFSEKNPDPWPAPRRLTKANIERCYSQEKGWRIDSIEEAFYEDQHHLKEDGRKYGYAYFAVITRL